MNTTDVRSQIRTQIRPFPRTATYPTSWAGPQTYQQIYDNLVHYVSNVMKSYGIRPYEMPDCLPCGFMALWMELIEKHDFLTHKTRRQAVFFVLARCKISSERRYQQKYNSLEELISYDWRNTVDEHTITGLEYRRDERWAAWATALDIRIDIERIMGKLAEKYANSPVHLVTLYALTTQVQQKDALSILGMTRTRHWCRHILEPLQDELRREFAAVFLERPLLPEPKKKYKKRTTTRQQTLPYRAWREQYQKGNTRPVLHLLEKYEDNQPMMQAIEDQIAGRSYTQIAQQSGRTYDQVSHWMKRAARELTAAYA